MFGVSTVAEKLFSRLDFFCSSSADFFCCFRECPLFIDSDVLGTEHLSRALSVSSLLRRCCSGSSSQRAGCLRPKRDPTPDMSRTAPCCVLCQVLSDLQLVCEITHTMKESLKRGSSTAGILKKDLHRPESKSSRLVIVYYIVYNPIHLISSPYE